METVFDGRERLIWAGRSAAYAASFAGLCAHTVPQLLHAAGVVPGVRLLDVGTGPGTVAAAGCARGASVTAVDADTGMVEMAARAVPDADVRVGLLPELPFPDGTFDAVTANFVLNHVGRPKEALVELRRVLRPGGRLALTIWALPHAPGQALLGRAVREGGAVSPPHSAGLAPEDDFTRDDPGLTALLDSAGLRDTRCATLRWNHRVSAEEWWGGPAAGVAAIGTLLCGQTPEVRAAIRRRFDQLSVEFTTEDGLLSLPHAALLARARR